MLWAGSSLDKELRDNAQVRTEGRVQFQYATAVAEKSGVWSSQITTTCSWVNTDDVQTFRLSDLQDSTIAANHHRSRNPIGCRHQNKGARVSQKYAGVSWLGVDAVTSVQIIRKATSERKRSLNLHVDALNLRKSEQWSLHRRYWR